MLSIPNLLCTYMFIFQKHQLIDFENNINKIDNFIIFFSFFVSSVIGDPIKVNICLKLAEKFSNGSNQIDALREEIGLIKPRKLEIESTGNIILLNFDF